MNRKLYWARPLSDLPFYCHPVFLFMASWIVMLGTLEIQVSESTFPDRWLGISLFVVSIATMFLGFWISRESEADLPDVKSSLAYTLDVARLRRYTSWLGISIVAIALYNWVFFGPPPIFGFFGVATENYIDYGRWKQALFPMAMALFVNSLLESSKMRRWFWSVLALGTLIAYVSRGDVILALAQGLILYTIRTSTSKRKIYTRAAIVVVIGFVALTVLGDNRTSRSLFLEFMEIKTDFREWPTAILWPISYFSVPISNLCWIVHNAHFTKPTLSFLYPVLPAFWAPVDPNQIALSDSHIIDGVHTYLANYFLDFSWIGVIACNFAIGLLSGFLVNRQRVSRQFLISPVFLSAMGFIFFWDFFVYLPTILELGIQAVIQRLCVVPVVSSNLDVTTTSRKLSSG